MLKKSRSSMSTHKNSNFSTLDGTMVKFKDMLSDGNCNNKTLSTHPHGVVKDKYTIHNDPILSSNLRWQSAP